MPKTVLAIGAHYDDCVFGIPGILLQAARKHYRVVILSLIGDYSNWAPVKGREKELLEGTAQISKEYGAEMRYLKYASHRYDVGLETKRAVAEVVAEVKPDVAFMMWHQDHHHDHEVAAVVSKVALRHGDRVLEQAGRDVQKLKPFTSSPVVLKACFGYYDHRGDEEAALEMSRQGPEFRHVWVLYQRGEYQRALQAAERAAG